MDRKIASERLRALATNDEKRSTASRLLDVIDDIEAALAAGVSRSAVVEELATLGLEMKPETFYSALKRIRKKRGKPSVPNKASASTVQESPKNEETEQEPEKDYDELAVLSARERRERNIAQFTTDYEPPNPLLHFLKDLKK
jgi:hypothetical protein